MATADYVDTPVLYGSSWYAASRLAVPPRAPLSVDHDADVCVIGGGLAGLTVAREIARRGWTVALLEARRIAWSASGRNSGFVLPGFASDARTLFARAGRHHARALWALSEDGAEYVRKAILENDMPGVELSQHGWLHVSKDDRDADMADDAELLQREFNADVEFWQTDRVRAALGSPLYFTGIHFNRGFTIHPLNYALGLAQAAEAAGARIYENSPVVEIDPAGVRKRVVTAAARVRASHIVLAGNVHLGELMPRISRTLFPVSTYVITTAPLGPQLHETIRYAGAVSDTDLADNHYRIVGGDRLIWSGRNTLWRGEPRRYVAGLLADLARAYPQLARTTADYAWTGMLGNTVHRMPQVGEMSPGVWLLSGFGSHGLNTTAMGGQMIARAIVEGDQSWQLFAPFELVWAGGMLGRATLQTYYWSYRARERLASKLARRREAERRRIEDEVRAAVAALGEPVAAPTMAAEVPVAPRQRRRWLPRLSRQAPGESGPSAQSPTAATETPAQSSSADALPPAQTPPPPLAEQPPSSIPIEPQPAIAAQEVVPAAALIEPETVSPAQTDETAAATAALEAPPPSSESSPPPAAEAQPAVAEQHTADAQTLASLEAASLPPTPAEPPAPAETREPESGSAPAQQGISRKQRRWWPPFWSRRATGDGPALDQSPGQVATARLLADKLPTGPSPAPAETVAPPAAEQIEPVDLAEAQELKASEEATPETQPATEATSPAPPESQPPQETSPALETRDEPAAASADFPEAASLTELPPDVTLKLDEPAFAIEPPLAADVPPQPDASPPADTSPPHPTTAEGAALADAQEPKADAAPAPKINSPEKKRSWFARFSRRKSSDEPAPDPPSPTAPDKPAERSSG